MYENFFLSFDVDFKCFVLSLFAFVVSSHLDRAWLPYTKPWVGCRPYHREAGIDGLQTGSYHTDSPGPFLWPAAQALHW